MTKPGNEASFRELFEESHNAVYRFFRRRGVGAEDAADLTQDTFFRVFQHLDRLKPGTRSTWILTIAANRWKNWLRHRSAAKRAEPEQSLDQILREEGEYWTPEELPSGASPPQDPLQNLERIEKLRRVRDVLDRLPPRQRSCLRLKLRGSTYSEIASILGISEMTVKSHIHQARRRLTEELKDESS